MENISPHIPLMPLSFDRACGHYCCPAIVATNAAIRSPNPHHWKTATPIINSVAACQYLKKNVVDRTIAWHGHKTAVYGVDSAAARYHKPIILKNEFNI